MFFVIFSCTTYFTQIDLAAEVSVLIDQWQKSKVEHDRNMEQLLASVKGSAIDPFIINCSLPMDTIASDAIEFLEGMLTQHNFL